MDLPRPFEYPDGIVHRRHAPAGYDDFSGFKPWLRDEFLFRCVYCLSRETWYHENPADFSVDHLVPRRTPTIGRALEFQYENLVYACTRCNSWRQAKNVLNPNSHNFRDHLKVDMRTGSVEGSKKIGRDTIQDLDLNHPKLIRLRQHYLNVLSLKIEFPSHPKVHLEFVKAFGFPIDLPDLRKLRPPKGNGSNSEESCYFALRERKELPEVY